MAMITASCQLSNRSSSFSSTCPSWLQAALADIEQKVQSLAATELPENSHCDSFADRAENYYQKRPQLLSLVQDLHNRYLHLADRYSQSLLKFPAPSSHFSSQISISISDDEYELPLSSVSTFSDPDTASSVCFNQSYSSSLDSFVTDLTITLVERNLLMDEVSNTVCKMDLQNKLLEVMESERTVLVVENARLEVRAATAEEEGRGLMAEVGWLRRKAGELAKCVLRMREEQRGMWALGRRIEALQRQVGGLERRNREWCEVMMRRREGEVRVEMEVERLKDENRRLREVVDGERRKGWGPWAKSGYSGGSGKGKGGKSSKISKIGCLWEPCFCLY